ncbi:hypothetical protein NQ314_019241 [Rhamnusium bicolor]|uniref:Luciferin 4-monooxygenase n=1 Tax=Rhamnusium bicolor TaxID=1586634 RepID=A0AAV8WNA1_9CUCU|nr:hypothetical protein NQ314_019241 [Rhamnusium bicolor]
MKKIQSKKLKQYPTEVLQFLEELEVDHSTGEQVSREKLLQSTIKLAVILQNFGITKDDTIGIISLNTWKYIIPIISSFYIGATTTAVNPNLHKDELLHCLKISKPKIIFISKNVLDKIRLLRDELSFLKYVMIFDGDSRQGDEILFKDLLSEYVDCTLFTIHKEKIEEAVMLYSSGTTGYPKGVTLTSDNLKTIINYCSHPEILNMNENSIFLVILPIYHIFGLLLVLSCILDGKRSIILDRFKPEVFLECIQNYKISKLVIVPPIAVFLAKSPLVDKYDITSLEDILCGAAPPWKRNGGNYFGKKTVGRDQTGEIYFKGPAVMKGYKNNEIETSHTIDPQGFLHTGDVGYFDKDGYLYIVDRYHQLSLEDLLLRHPAVKDCGVVGRPDERAGELPTAFIVKQPNVDITEDELIAYIAGL